MTTAVRFHGRGGQGVVTAAELLSSAAFDDGLHAQAFPSFGSERTGAPVVAFCRVSEQPIRAHEPIAEPDVVIIQDPTLLLHVDVFGGLVDGGLALINTERELSELGLDEAAMRFRLHAVPATRLAREHLGRPLPGAPLLGALAALTSIVGLSALASAIDDRFSGPAAEGNRAAARAAHALEDVRA